jgi:RNA polymerase sigma factor (sigma-70 family)
LLRGLQYFHSFEGTNARFWLLGIVRNSFYDWSKQQKAHHAMHDVFEEDIHTSASSAPYESNSDPEAHLLRLRIAGRIDQALNRLPLVFREVVILRDVEDLSYKEMAQLLDIPVGTVMSRLARGRQELCALLKEMKPKLNHDNDSRQ